MALRLYLLTVGHIVGLALGVGASTVKLFLLLKCRKDPSFAKVYLEVARTITRLMQHQRAEDDIESPIGEWKTLGDRNLTRRSFLHAGSR